MWIQSRLLQELDSWRLSPTIRTVSGSGITFSETASPHRITSLGGQQVTTEISEVAARSAHVGLQIISESNRNSLSRPGEHRVELVRSASSRRGRSTTATSAAASSEWSQGGGARSVVRKKPAALWDTQVTNHSSVLYMIDQSQLSIYILVEQTTLSSGWDQETPTMSPPGLLLSTPMSGHHRLNSQVWRHSCLELLQPLKLISTLQHLPWELATVNHHHDLTGSQSQLSVRQCRPITIEYLTMKYFSVLMLVD